MQEALFFLSALGAFNGLLLSIYLIFFTKPKSLSKYLLAGLILSLSIRIGKSVILYFNPEVPKVILQFGLSACFFIGPFLYFYIKATSQNIDKMPRSWKWVIASLAILVVVVGLTIPYNIYPASWNDVFIYFIYGTWVLFTLAAGLLLRDTFSKYFNNSVKLTQKEKWLSIIYFANLLICSLYVAVLFGAQTQYYITGPLLFSLFMYIMIFGFFYSNNFDFNGNKKLRKYANKKISKQAADNAINQLETLMKEKKLYQNPNLKLQDIADSIDVPSHRLSQILNDNLGKSYVSYINEYRIEFACKLINNSDTHLSLEGIGKEVGFKSKSTFFSTFKKIKGLTPAAFQQLERENV